ncbi:MAG: Stk1 family PASTA domain-containing Ser/Thr kinase [Stackebrandtia sp.]
MTAQPTLLGGRYEIGGVLGYGGMAEVHRGRDMRLGRDVAVKTLRSDLARDETFQTRFRREAQNAASLNHPSIVAVYDTGEDSSSGSPIPYIVMEYVEGRTLKEVLEAEYRLSPRRACEVVSDVCAALDFSHRHQIIHRDVKPGNVMVASNGQVKVMDFGIARAMASGQATMTQTSAVIGTAQYLSPEQARGETVDARSDVYATGCLVYELLCGDPPFTGDNPVSVAYQHVREAPVPPSHVNPDVPPSVDAIVLKALAKNPANRYQSAGEMREDLERAIAGRPVLATPVLGDDERTQLMGAPRGDETQLVSAYEDEPKHVGRKIAAGALALLLVGLLGFGLFWLLNGDKVDVPDVVGKEEDKAIAALEEVNLDHVVEPKETDNEDEVGIVLEQSPEAPATASEGDKVTLTVGIGPGDVEVPDLSEYTSCNTVEDKLETEGLKADCETVPGPAPEGKLVKQDPEAGDMAEKGATVKVELSDGTQSKVPDVVGLSEEAACEELDDAGFECQVGEYVEGNEVDTVASQQPEAEADAETGAVVTIDVVGVTVPSDLIGKTIEEINQLPEFANGDLVLEAGDAEDDWVVLSQEPGDGVVKKGTTVTVEAEDPGPV